MAADGSRTAVIAAFIANLLISIAKFAAVAITGSAAMLSEAYHSVADTGNQAMLLWGMRQSKQPPDAAHPFGRGKETYFWSFMVAVMLFAGGAVLAFSHGIEAVRHPHEVENVAISFIVLGFAMLFEGVGLTIAVREFNRGRGSRRLLRSIRDSKDASLLVVLFEDSAALLGLVIAMAGTGLMVVTGDSRWDGVASLAIGAILTLVAILLAFETKALLIGEAAPRTERSGIRSELLAMPEVVSVGKLMTMQMGPKDVLVNVEIDMSDDLSTEEIEGAVDRAEAAILRVIPHAGTIFVELEPRNDG